MSNILEKETIKDLVGSKDDPVNWIYSLGEGLPQVREITVKTDCEDKTPVTIAQLTDLHFNFMNEQDLEEKNPTLMSTYEHRWWLANGEGKDFAEPALKYAEKISDQIVITGDVMDYCSNGCAEMLQKEIWDKYPEALVTTGNHEWCQNMEGTVAETLTFDQRRERLEKAWKHNLYYTSKVVKDKVMLILLENGRPGFWDCQIEPLKADLKLAREKGYAVLAFMHIALATNNPDCKAVKALIGDRVENFVDGPVVGGAFKDNATQEVYNILTNNADVIKGVFTGHFHYEFYTEIIAKTPDGEEKNIPQIVSNVNCACRTGCVTKINVI